MDKKKEILVECHDLEGKIKKVPASELSYRPSVYGVCIEDDKILLSRQFDGYDFPGGGVELHETLTEALKRECWEETGFTVEPLGLIVAETSFYVPKYKEGAWNAQVIYYAVKKTGGEFSIENFDEHEKEYVKMAEWVPLSEIEKLKFYNSVNSVRIIQRAIRDEYAPL